jgi:hypothetical protein
MCPATPPASASLSSAVCESQRLAPQPTSQISNPVSISLQQRSLELASTGLSFPSRMVSTSGGKIHSSNPRSSNLTSVWYESGLYFSNRFPTFTCYCLHIRQFSQSSSLHLLDLLVKQEDFWRFFVVKIGSKKGGSIEPPCHPYLDIYLIRFQPSTRILSTAAASSRRLLTL